MVRHGTIADMSTPPARLCRGVRWLLDVDPPTRGRTPAWALGLLGCAIALYAALTRTSSRGGDSLVVYGFVRDAARRMLAGEPFALVAIDFSPALVFASAPLNLLGRTTAHVVVLLLSGLATIVVVRCLGLRGWSVGLVAAAVISGWAAHLVLVRGDWLIPLLALVLGDALLARRRDGVRWAGYLGGAVVAMSPVFTMFLVPGVLRHRGRVLAHAAIGFVAAALPGFLLAPQETWSFWRYHQLKRLIFNEGTLIHQPFVAVLLHATDHGGRIPAVALLTLVWGLALAVCVLAVRRGRQASAMAAGGVAAFFWAAWPVSSILLLPLVAVLFSRAPGRASRVPATALVLLGVVGVWTRLPEDPYGTTVRVTPLIAVLIVAWLVLHTVELLEIRALRPIGSALTWTILTLPFLTAYYFVGTFLYPLSNPWNPWRPGMPDFQVYVIAATNFAAGLSPYNPQEWPFLYPPIGAVLAWPSVHWLVASQAVWTGLKVAAFLLVMYRIGLRDWRGPAVLSFAIATMGALNADLGMGNLQGLMVALVFLDLAPGRTLFQDLTDRFGWSWPRGRTRLIPPGVLTGVITAIKIIPALFLVLLALGRHWRPIITAVISAVVMTLLGAVIAPTATVEFAGMLLRGELDEDLVGVTIHYLSLATALERFGVMPGLATLLSYLVGLSGLFAAWRWYRAGRHWIGLSLCGLATVFFSPVAWNYYYVWMLPALLIVVRQIALDTPMPRWIQFTIICAAGWMAFEYHLGLPNGWVTETIQLEMLYSIGQKFVAGGMPLSTAVVLIAAAALGRRRPAERRVAPTEPDEGVVDAPTPAFGADAAHTRHA